MEDWLLPYTLVPRDKAGLLIAVIRGLAGDARMSFEGDLRRCVFPAELQPSGAETTALRRNTIHPLQDFLVIRLEPEMIRPILTTVLPEGRFMRDVIHVQIEKNGTLEFGAYDNFDAQSVGCSQIVWETVVPRLLSSGVLRSADLKAGS